MSACTILFITTTKNKSYMKSETLTVYVSRLNSRKHIKACNLGDNTFQFRVYQLVKLKDIRNYQDREILKVFKDDVLISIYFGLSKETIGFFAAFANTDLAGVEAPFKIGYNVSIELNKQSKEDWSKYPEMAMKASIVSNLLEKSNK